MRRDRTGSLGRRDLLALTFCCDGALAGTEVVNACNYFCLLSGTKLL